MIQVNLVVAAVVFAFVSGVIVGAFATLACDLADEFARDEQPEGAWRGAERVGVHAGPLAQAGGNVRGE